MHILFSILASLAAIFAPLLNTAPPVQAGPAYAIAAVRAAKPIACGKNWGCFYKAVFACKPATITQVLTDTDQGILATETNAYAITGKNGERCNFSMTIAKMTASFDPTTRIRFIKEARRSGKDPNKIIKDVNKMLRPFVGKNVKCTLPPDNLKSLVEQARYHYPDMNPADWEKYGCTGTLLEQQTNAGVTPPEPDESDAVVPAAQRKDCKDLIRADGTPIVSAKEASSFLGGNWKILSSFSTGYLLESCSYSMTRENETGGVVIHAPKDGYWDPSRNEYLERAGKTVNGLSYGAVPGLGDEAFYLKHDTDPRSMGLFIRKGSRRVILDCGPLCTDEKQIELGRLLISRWR